MAKGKRYPSGQVVLNDVKPTWVTLVKPDTEFNSDGQYGVGFCVTEEQAELLNALAEKLTAGTDIPVKYLKAGDMTRATMKASGLDKKTNQKWFDVPSIFTPELDKASPEQVAQIGKRSRLKLNVTMQPYESGIGKGVSVRLAAVQILDFVKAAEAQDFGFTSVAVSADETEESPF